MVSLDAKINSGLPSRVRLVVSVLGRFHCYGTALMSKAESGQDHMPVNQDRLISAAMEPI